MIDIMFFTFAGKMYIMAKALFLVCTCCRCSLPHLPQVTVAVEGDGGGVGSAGVALHEAGKDIAAKVLHFGVGVGDVEDFAVVSGDEAD